MTAKNVPDTAVAYAGADSAPTAPGGPAAPSGPARPDGAAGDVWDALVANPGATVTAITEAAQVSRATVARALSAMEGDGRATRTRGGRDANNRRLPDTWTAIATEATPGNVTPDAAAVPPHTDNGTRDVGDAPDATVSATATATGQAVETGFETEALSEARAALSAMGAAIAAALKALDAGNGADALSAMDAVYGGSGRARRLVRGVVHGRARSASGQPRSLPGQMRAKIAAHLAAYPGLQFTPHEVGKALGHSAGAVSNALDRLVEAGEAELVCERPRRFAVVRDAVTPSSAPFVMALSGR